MIWLVPLLHRLRTAPHIYPRCFYFVFLNVDLHSSLYLCTINMTTAAGVYPPLESRPLKDTICLFDVDETLTKARRVCSSNSNIHSTQFTNVLFTRPSSLKCLSCSLVSVTSAPLATSVFQFHPPQPPTSF